MRYLLFLVGFSTFFSVTVSVRPLEVSESAGPDSFALVDGTAATVWVDPDEPAVVREVAADAFVADVERVTDVKPRLKVANEWDSNGPAVIIGTAGQSDLLAKLNNEGLLDTADLDGRWEAFKIVHLPEQNALVIAGSDRRGTAYGVFEVSRAIGVSPWYWWADVPIKQSESLHLTTDGQRIGPPSVKYRGIFLNDEDWGLQPWAAKTYEPDTNDIGPKTYAAIFELLLRLKANYIWPAMHPSTRAFNYYPDNKLVADRYAIVMGSSHAEPMLRNNVDEWERDGSGEWNFVSNPDAILKYWDERVAENGRFENVYTIGMRGIHDSAMVGGGRMDEKVGRLEQIFSAQRDMLKRHVGKPADQVPQVFVPYKEVLGIYRGGLEVPPDVTLGWVDDNHGFIRQLSNADERKRPGGAGVYYHLSYWGRPHDFLWIDSISPGLTWEEMTKAYEYEADRLWVVNVGDIKPNEIGMDWFLRIAWEVDRYGPDDARQGLIDFSRESFGDNHAEAIAEILFEYYRLNFPRKPEHMGWSTVYPTTPIQDSEMSHWAHGDEAQRRLDAFDAMESRAEALGESLPDEARDAFFQLVLYPVSGAADMNRKIIHAEKSRLLAQRGWPAANEHARLAQSAHDRIQENTRHYNGHVADGKWNGMMTADPRGLPVYGMPTVGTVEASGRPVLAVRLEGKSVPALADGESTETDSAVPRRIPLDLADAQVAGNLKRARTSGGTVVGLPQTDEDGFAQPADGSSRARFRFTVDAPGKYILRFEVNHPDDRADSWHLQLDDNAPTTWNDHQTDGQWQWFDVAEYALSAGRHQLDVIAREDGAQLRNLVLMPADSSPVADSPALTETPNELPTLNRYTRRQAFIDLHNTGSGSVNWVVTAREPWVKFSTGQGNLETHRRVLVDVDYDQAPRQDRVVANIEIRSDTKQFTLTLPVRNPADDLPAGTFVQENNYIAIDAEHFAASEVGPSAVAWRVIEGVGYSGAAAGVFPRLLPDGVELSADGQAPTLSYPLHVFDGGPATLTLQALPTHEINDDHALVCAIALNDGPPQTIRFAHGNDEHNRTWQRNVLRGAMTGTTSLDLTPGRHTLKVYGLDPSVVLDRLFVSFEPATPAYFGPRETRIGDPGSP